MASRGTTTEDEPSDKGFASGGGVFDSEIEFTSRALTVVYALFNTQLRCTRAARAAHTRRSVTRTTLE